MISSLQFIISHTTSCFTTSHSYSPHSRLTLTTDQPSNKEKGKCRRCKKELETIDQLMRCDKNEDTPGRWRKMVVEFGGGVQPRKILLLTMGKDEPEMKRAIAVITAVMVKENMKGSGKTGWKKMRTSIQNICEGQKGREKTQMEICLQFMDSVEEGEE